jgi:hypothetical protein
MRKLLILFAFFSFVKISAQNNFTLKQSSVSAIPKRVIFDPMPNALPVKIFDGIKMGNNGQGFDLYKSEPDNMIVAKPDSSLYDNMPNAINYSAVPPTLLKQIEEHLKDLSIDQNNKTEKSFKLIQPDQNKSLLELKENKIIPIAPFLPR